MGVMPMLLGEYNIAAFIADEVFVVRWNQKKLAPPEAPCSAIVCQIEFTSLVFNHMKIIAQECDATATVTDIQS